MSDTSLNIFIQVYISVLPPSMEAGFNARQFAFTGFQISPTVTVPADIQTVTPVEESSAPEVESESVEDAVEKVGADKVAPVVPEVPVIVPDQKEGASSGASAAVGKLVGNFRTVNSNSSPVVSGGVVSKKSKRLQERDDEELISRVRELVVAGVRAEVRAGLDAYVEEVRTAVREVKVGNKVLEIKWTTD